MIALRPLFPHDRGRIERLLLANADDLNWMPEETWRRAAEISLRARLGYKALVNGELGPDLGKCVAVAILNRGDHESTKHTAWLRVVVDREWRGKGIGRNVVVEAIHLAQQEGIVRVEAQPYASSDFINFWAHAGFKFEGRRRNAARNVHTGRLETSEVWAWHA